MREQLIRSPALGKVDIELAGNYGAAQAAAMHGDQCSGHLGEVTPSRPSGPVTAPPDASASVSASSGGVPAFSEDSPTISGGAAAPVIGESPLSFEEARSDFGSALEATQAAQSTGSSEEESMAQGQVSQPTALLEERQEELTAA